jgi:hypothetical protein
MRKVWRNISSILLVYVISTLSSFAASFAEPEPASLYSIEALDPPRYQALFAPVNLNFIPNRELFPFLRMGETSALNNWIINTREECEDYLTLAKEYLGVQPDEAIPDMGRTLLSLVKFKDTSYPAEQIRQFLPNTDDYQREFDEAYASFQGAQVVGENAISCEIVESGVSRQPSNWREGFGCMMSFIDHNPRAYLKKEATTSRASHALALCMESTRIDWSLDDPETTALRYVLGHITNAFVVSKMASLVNAHYTEHGEEAQFPSFSAHSSTGGWWRDFGLCDLGWIEKYSVINRAYFLRQLRSEQLPREEGAPRKWYELE